MWWWLENVRLYLLLSYIKWLFLYEVLYQTSELIFVGSKFSKFFEGKFSLMTIINLSFLNMPQIKSCKNLFELLYEMMVLFPVIQILR